MNLYVLIRPKGKILGKFLNVWGAEDEAPLWMNCLLRSTRQRRLAICYILCNFCLRILILNDAVTSAFTIRGSTCDSHSIQVAIVMTSCHSILLLWPSSFHEGDSYDNDYLWEVLWLLLSDNTRHGYWFQHSCNLLRLFSQTFK